MLSGRALDLRSLGRGFYSHQGKGFNKNVSNAQTYKRYQIYISQYIRAIEKYSTKSEWSLSQ